MAYFTQLLIFFLITALLGYCLNVPIGYAGVLAFCSSVFTGTGAYVFTLSVAGRDPNNFTQDLWLVGQLSVPVALFLAALAAGLLGSVVGLIVSPFKGDFLVFTTIAIQIIWAVIVENAVGLTNGVTGIRNFTDLDFMGGLPREYRFVVLLIVTGLGLLALIFRLCRSAFGESLIAIRDDRLAAESIGISHRGYIIAAFAVAGMGAGLVGAIIAAYFGAISPRYYTLNSSIMIVTILLLGGSGNLIGPAVGALALLSLPEIIRFFRLPPGYEANLREFIYGLALVAIMYWRPQGLVGSHKYK